MTQTTPETCESLIEKAGKQRTTHRTQVLEAIHQLHNLEVVYIDTAAIMRVTGLQRGQVADAIKDLRNLNLIGNPDGRDGLYIPLETQLPSQAITVTALPNGGGVKIEKGDQIMELTPHEWVYELAPLAAGASAQAVVMEHVTRTIALATRVQKLEGEVKGLKELREVDPRQMNLAV